jgi:hypothetical protein
LVIAQQQASLERKLAPRGIDVKWSEFTSGPPMLEAMNAGSVDIRQVGDTPPIFAQAAGAAILYVAGQPMTIYVKMQHGIRTVDVQLIEMGRAKRHRLRGLPWAPFSTFANHELRHRRGHRWAPSPRDGSFRNNGRRRPPSRLKFGRSVFSSDGSQALNCLTDSF